MKLTGMLLTDTDDFEEKASQYLAQGNMEALKQLYVQAAASARMTHGRAGGREIEAVLLRVLTAVNDSIPRGIFDDL